jgi:hypothetical protein
MTEIKRENRPNNTMDWEQKISNEKIYERNFELHMPTVPVLNPSLLDRQRYREVNIKNKNMLIDLSIEDETFLANYWYVYIYQNKKGLNVRNGGNIVPKYSLDWFLKKFNGNKPWLETSIRNINHDSELRIHKPNIYSGYLTTTNKDCIKISDIKKLDKINTLANIKLIEPNKGIYPTYTPKWYNNFTH